MLILFSPHFNHQERARDIINNGWDAVVGVKIRCVPEKDYAALAGLGAWAFAMRAAQDWSMASEEDRRKGTGAGGEGSGAARMTPKRCRSLAITIGFLGSRLTEGIKAIERAISLNPNSALALIGFANVKVAP